MSHILNTVLSCGQTDTYSYICGTRDLFSALFSDPFPKIGKRMFKITKSHKISGLYGRYSELI
jgi:hypothetical protein